MAAAAILEKFRMAISLQRLTIYLYSAHRAVIFAIAQLSCSNIITTYYKTIVWFHCMIKHELYLLFSTLLFLCRL